MNVEVIQFTKVQKQPSIIEEKLNSVLSNHSFMYLNHSQSSNGSVTIVLYTGEKKQSGTKAKVFRGRSKDIQKDLQEFWSSGSYKLRQSSLESSQGSSSLLHVVIYDELSEPKVSVQKELKPQEKKSEEPKSQK